MSNTPTQAQLEAEYKLFTDAIERHVPISPPAQKPASVPGGSGAALVGTLSTFVEVRFLVNSGVHAEALRLLKLFPGIRWDDYCTLIFSTGVLSLADEVERHG